MQMYQNESRVCRMKPDSHPPKKRRQNMSINKHDLSSERSLWYINNQKKSLASELYKTTRNRESVEPTFTSSRDSSCYRHGTAGTAQRQKHQSLWQIPIRRRTIISDRTLRGKSWWHPFQAHQKERCIPLHTWARCAKLMARYKRTSKQRCPNAR